MYGCISKPRKAASAVLRVVDGWLIGRAHPESKVELESWGADVVASRSCRAGGDIARWIVEAAASASAVKDHLVCAVYPTCRGGDCAEDCKQLAQGNRVVVHCRQGQRRTCVAIYWLLRLIVGAPEKCLLMMKKMRPATHEEFLRTTLSPLLKTSVFKEGVAMRTY